MVRGAYFVSNWKEKIVSECKLRGYSRKTISGYVYYVGRFLYSDLSLEGFLINLSDAGKSTSTLRTAGFAVKFYLRLLGVFDADKIPNAKSSKKLPVILSKKEILLLASSTNNFKHRVIILLMYSAGLRLSELINLCWKDIDFERKIIHIKQSKGKKDRVVMLSSKVKRMLSSMYADKTGLVFVSSRNSKYSPASIEKIVVLRK